MNLIDEGERQRTLALLQTVESAVTTLRASLQRLPEPLTAEWLQDLANNPAQQDMIEALAARFGRVQDMLGATVLPQLLKLEAEPPRAAIDMFNYAEKMGYLPSAQRWLAARNLRNQLVHEYLSNSSDVIVALQAVRAMVVDCESFWQAVSARLRGLLA